MSIEMKRVGWKNGTLISKAKVEVDGVIYEVEPEQYSGDTPLSAENLKKMEDNAQEAINKVDEKLIGTVLYENAKGTGEDMTLSDNADNYDYFDFYCKRNTHIYTVRVYKPNNNTVSLTTSFCDGSYIYVYTKILNVSGTQITVVRANIGYFNNTGSYAMTDDNNLVTKIVGYKIS